MLQPVNRVKIPIAFNGSSQVEILKINCDNVKDLQKHGINIARFLLTRVPNITCQYLLAEIFLWEQRNKTTLVSQAKIIADNAHSKNLESVSSNLPDLPEIKQADVIIDGVKYKATLTKVS